MPAGRTLQDTGNVLQALRTLRAYFDTPLAECVVSAGNESADVRRITFQVVDRLGKSWGGRWLVLFWISPTQDGPPDSSGNSVSFVAGTQEFESVVANAAYIVETDDDGRAQIDLEVTGAGVRFFRSGVVAKVKTSESFAWA